MIKTEQLRALVGRNVEMVCFAQFSVYIHLEGGILLTVEAGFEHAQGEMHRENPTTFPITQSSLMTILESAVASASLNANGDLPLVLSNGDSLGVTKEPGLESYRLKIGGEEFFP